MKKIVSAPGMFPAALATLLLAVSAVALTGCGDSAMIITDSRPGDQCVVGSAPVRAAACTQTCQDGFTAGLRCVGGQVSACTCIPNGEFPSGSQDAGSGACVNGTTRASTCVACPAGQYAHETCTAGVWGSCICVAQNTPMNPTCEPNSETFNACATCSSGHRARQVCNSDGRGYGRCECVPNGTQVCQPSVTRPCSYNCPGGPTVNGTQACRADGQEWLQCQLPAGACQGTGVCTNGASENCAYQGCPGGVAAVGTRVCSGGQWGACVLTASGCPAPSTCSNGQTRSCTFSCSGGGTVAGTETCANGAYGTCVQNAGTTCGGGGSSGNGTLRLRIDPGFWEYDRTAAGASTGVRFCSQSELNVRCFDWRGEQVRSPRTTDRVINLDSNWSGYVRCDVVCGDASGAPVHPALLDGRFTGSPMGGTRGILTASVTGRGGSLENQIDVFRTCAGPGGPKFEVAINVDRLGRCAQ